MQRAITVIASLIATGVVDGDAVVEDDMGGGLARRRSWR